MVKTYRGSSHKLHLTAVQQLFVTAGTCSHNQCIGITHVVSRYLRAPQGNDFVGQQGQFFANIGNLVVNYYLHTAAKIQNSQEISVKN